MQPDLTRRKFIGSAAASGVFTIVPRHVLGGAAYVPPNDKITLAHIGMGTQGFTELGGLLAEPEIQIVAVCDPNTDSSDYVEWGKDEHPDHDPRVPGKSRLAGEPERLPRRAGGRPRSGRYLLRQPAGREKFQVMRRVCRLPRIARTGERPRRGEDHDARPSPRHDLHRGNEEGQARPGAQAAGQPPARRPAGRRDRPPDEDRHAPSGLRHRDGQRVDRPADQGRE